MITVLNTNTLGVSEYDISDVLDIVSASGVTYYVTPSGIYFFDDDSSESVTAAYKTGKIRIQDNSPKRFPHIELSCDNPDAEILVIEVFEGTEVTGIFSTKHTDTVRGYRLPNIKSTELQLKVVGVSDSNYKVYDVKSTVIDTMVKK
jgi:hypothetical protein